MKELRSKVWAFLFRKVFYICIMGYFYKPVMCTVQAIQFNGGNANDIQELIGKENSFYNKSNGLWIFLPYGQKKVHIDDFVLLAEDKAIKIYDPIDFKKDFELVT
jgi:hypothetical protein